jgi:hypothetical protein
MIRGCIRVSIRRAQLVGSKQVEYSVVTVGRYEDELSAVVAGCRYAHQWWQEREGDRESAERAREYYGDHDPKGGR